jgi:DNA-binding CsgD family transcriptional regulator
MRVLWANATALRWLEAEDCMTLVSGRLVVGQSQFAVRRLLAGASHSAGGICIPIERSSNHLILCAKRVSRGGQDETFGITAHRTDEASQSDLFGVQEVFHLTCGEFSVLQLLAQGMTAQEAARKQGTSVETVRTHIRRLYAKLEVNSREGLFTRLRPFLIRV